MSEVLGRGVIEISADARQLKASIEDAKKSIRTLGEGQKDISRQARVSIDQYIGKLQQQNATFGKTVRETELFKLAIRGASDEQLRSADAALRVAAAHEASTERIAALKSGFIALATVAAAVGGALAASAISSIDFLDRLNDLTKSTGLSAEELAGLSLLAKQTGTDLDGLAKGINKMTVEIGKNPEAFKALGVTASDAIGQFKQLADVFNLIPDIALRNALAQKVFNKSWQELAPALSEGSQKIGEAIEKGQRLSGITTEMTKNADEFKDKLEELKITGAAFGASFLPILTNIVKQLVAAKEGASGFRETIANFLAISGRQADDPVKALVDVDAKLAKLRTTAAELSRMGPVQRLFSFDDRAIVNEQISRAERAREQLVRLISQSPDTSGLANEDAQLGTASIAEDERRKREQARTTALARAFVSEPKAGKDTADQEAKAQLAFDLEQIRKAGDASIGEFSRAERILEARRAAALVQDREYYAAKLSFINLNGQAQEKALQEEIARLQRETFTGENAAKDKIDNDRKIADAQAKLDKARAESVANREVNAIQEAAANERVRQTYLDAADAANAYIDSIKRRNEAEIAGIGRGDKFRQQQAGQLEIEARFLEQRRKLEGELRRRQIEKPVFDTYLQLAADAYKQETELYRLRTRAINDAQSDWVNGAREALQNYYDETRNIAKLTEDAFTNAFKGLEDTLTNFLTTGKLDFKSFAQSVVSDINRIFVKQQITGPLADLIKNGGLLEKAKGVLGGGTIAQQAPAPVVERTIADAITPAEAAASAAADGAAFSASIAASSAEFSTAVIASSTTFAPEILAAATSFSSIVVAAGAEFAATIATGAATSGGSSGAAGLFDAGASILGSFADGINYIPRTGVYELHQGERVVPASENARGWGSAPMINISQSFAPGTDKRTIQQAAAASGRAVQRELARGTAG